ncbi:MAG: DUF4333 domain-containing protein [Solirubrobacteraceae bacterium]|jgi:hypothetical protein|nr:DUF4333 domain-containing protein [Solirubrobacteraceae bacterium]MCU0312548.1 DUF4333 domain-containing protein [Solirubrobacteraceae bacterium]
MRRLLVMTLACAGAMTLTACSGNAYDAQTVEDKLKETQRDKVRGLPIGEARCPDDVELKEGVTFRCTLEIAGKPAPYRVRLTDVEAEKVTINVEPARALIATGAVVEFLRAQLPAALSSAKVSCGDERLLIADPGTKIGCVVTVDGKENQVVLRVKDTKGNVVIEP